MFTTIMNGFTLSVKFRKNIALELKPTLFVTAEIRSLLQISGSKMYAGKKIRVIFQQRIPETVPIANLLSGQERAVNRWTLFKNQDPRHISTAAALYSGLNKGQEYGRAAGVFKSAKGATGLRWRER